MFVYVVKSGDSLFGIGRNLGVSMETLQAVNGLTATNIVVGQALLVPSDVYTVQSGDSFWSIARAVHVPLNDLLQANPGVRPENLQPGMRLNLPSVDRHVASHFSFSQLRTPALDQSVIADNAPYLTYIGLFETHFNWNGDLSPINDNAAVIAAWQGRVTPLLTVTNLTEAGFNSELVRRVLNTPDVQAHLIDNIIAAATSRGYGGVTIDFEGVQPADRQAFVTFLQALRTRTQAAGLNLSLSLIHI